MNLTDYITKGINISCTTINNTSYIYIEDKEELLTLNDIGSFVWSIINGNRTVNDIIDVCLKQFAGEHSLITDHVKQFIDLLINEKMIINSSSKFQGIYICE